MDQFWSQYSESITRALGSVIATDRAGNELEIERAFRLLCEWTITLRDSGGTLHFAGNGASACMASHLAVDWTKNAGVHALAYNDVAFLTAIGNDLGYDQVFARPLEWYGHAGDVLVTISASGNSPNVLRAIEVARRKACRVVTLSGMKPDNLSRRLGDLNLYVPALTYGIAECSHQVLLHAWLDRFMNVREWKVKMPQAQSLQSRTVTTVPSPAPEEVEHWTLGENANAVAAAPRFVGSPGGARR
jgi:D-sedoheptulose 7-phosphate isomerase